MPATTGTASAVPVVLAHAHRIVCIMHLALKREGGTKKLKRAAVPRGENFAKSEMSPFGHDGAVPSSGNLIFDLISV